MEEEQAEIEPEQMMVSKDSLLEPLHSLPPVEFAVAYGSGVFHQEQTSPEMVDYIFGVSSPADWHSENIKKNPKHYSSLLSSLGGKAVANVARTLGVGVHFNPYVKWENKMIKYGVIGIPDLVTDINTWNRFYISGRLQKPVCVLADESKIVEQNNVNLRAAFSTAVLSLPYQFSEEDLYEAICGLSYLGDIRTLFAEDQSKVSREAASRHFYIFQTAFQHPQVTKIVQGNFSNFRNLYNDIIHEAAAKDLIKPKDGGSYTQDLGAKGISGLVSQLPPTLLQRLASKTGTKYEGPTETVPIAHALVDQGVVLRPLTVKAAVASIVRRSSARQAVSGFLAAGAINSFKYASKKMAKAMKSIK